MGVAAGLFVSIPVEGSMSAEVGVGVGLRPEVTVRRGDDIGGWFIFWGRQLELIIIRSPSISDV